MSNAFQRFIELIPKQAEYIGTVQSADHPSYKVLVVDGTGLVICTSVSKFYVGDRVYIQGTEIKRSAPTGSVVQIEV